MKKEPLLGAMGFEDSADLKKSGLGEEEGVSIPSTHRVAIGIYADSDSVQGRSRGRPMFPPRGTVANIWDPRAFNFVHWELKDEEVDQGVLGIEEFAGEECSGIFFTGVTPRSDILKFYRARDSVCGDYTLLLGYEVGVWGDTDLETEMRRLVGRYSKVVDYLLFHAKSDVGPEERVLLVSALRAVKDAGWRNELGIYGTLNLRDVASLDPVFKEFPLMSFIQTSFGGWSKREVLHAVGTKLIQYQGEE